MDVVSHPGDVYGEAREDFILNRRKSTLREIRENCLPNSDNETDVKGTLTILDNLDAITVDSASERDKVIASFRKHGITALPDGRKIDDIVHVIGTPVPPAKRKKAGGGR